MSRFSQQREKYGHSSELSLDNHNEGTAARTRPFSFDEIMLKRKNKKVSEGVNEGAVEAVNKLGKDVVEDVSDHFESGRGYKRNKNSLSGVGKHLSEDILKVSSIEKDSTYMKEDDLAKGKNKSSHESETKLKAKLDKDMSNEAKGGRIDKRVYGRRKDDERPRDDSENESERKHSKNLLGKDRYADRSRGKSERESKRKHRNGDDEKNRDRNTVTKHDTGKRHDLVFSERRERRETTQSRYEESRPKRRRSRSREREDRDRRSISFSPRAQNHPSYHKREHGELSSHSLKDRPGRQHSDVERNKISTNGSSSHYRRPGGFASGIGGYSPRKRRSEAAVRTPSPTNRSPEKKNAGWDLPPTKTDILFTSSVSNFQSSSQIVSSNVHEMASAVPVASSTAKPLSGVFANTLSTKNNASIDSIQLTQATRPLRRLYLENVPASASEKAVIECFNSFLLSSGVNYIRGTEPCISCIINKEKGQALVEFLTPEDASAALSFDGCYFSGSILKIRRPKDFVEVAFLRYVVVTIHVAGFQTVAIFMQTGVPEKSVASVDAISNTVKDSPHKIFIGGISKALSSEMFMGIASAFGPLKAYHFLVNEDHNEPCAFLEYVDQTVTLKACAGLNGMKLGGQVLTAVQAIPNDLSVENTGNSPFYGIPEHAKPLLEKPTQVLKLKNVFNPDGLSSLSEQEMEEVLEDIRLECARFGTVKSVNVVKFDNNCTTNPEAYEVTDHSGSAGALQDLGCEGKNTRTETLEEVTDYVLGGISGAEFPSNVREFIEVDKIAEDDSINNDKLADSLMKDESCEPDQTDSNMAVEEQTCQNDTDAISQELPNNLESTKVQSNLHDDKVTDIIQVQDLDMEDRLRPEEELNSEEVNVTLQEAFVGLDVSVGTKSDAIGKGDNREQVCDLGHVFEQGCVLVEYGRTEACCMAAHCLHGRFFDDRIVSVGYVAYDLYRLRFPK
ncbi:hypothetical protein L1049_017692 [Liquidambar formosana]|uniref:RRM domain-containing protein n=1 Tax=Liquidambar formosana TaxID=63359 RepID=A0AAP0S177_LIQFO